ncbi:MAG: phosphate propanoyltransferase [Oscillospiraceae bacterium]|jgi:putative phosphotransacetylase|nr:phosphate propanoyltransferase [Oscillospiraceae bacterium]
MDERRLRALVERIILARLAQGGERFVPVAVSNRHVHLCQRDVDALFGAGYTLRKRNDLAQPGQYACEERVWIETAKGRLALRVVGPVRGETQAEISATDAARLGIPPVVRLSGDLADTPGARLSSGEQRIEIARGVIVAARHLHLSAQEAADYGLRDGDTVSLMLEGPRAAVLGQVVVRAGEGHLLEAHIDTDEANAALLQPGALARVLVAGGGSGGADLAGPIHSADRIAFAGRTGAGLPQPKLSAYAPPKGLISEGDVRAARNAGLKTLPVPAGALVTPLARDAARAWGITLAAAERQQGGGL